MSKSTKVTYNDIRTWIKDHPDEIDKVLDMDSRVMDMSRMTKTARTLIATLQDEVRDNGYESAKALVLA